MSGGRGRKVVAGVIIGAVGGAAGKGLRGDPAPGFAPHPPVDGGPRPATRPGPATAAAGPAIEPETVVQATLLPVADVAADEIPAPAPAAEVAADAPARGAAWVSPVDGACPDGYPVKAKL